MSEQIHQLERSLDLSLFERTRSGIRLTEAGRRTLEHTTIMFRAAEALVTSIGRRDDASVTLRIGISFAVSRCLAPDFLRPLIKLDGCVPSVWRAELPELLQALRRHEVDLALVESAPVAEARDHLRVADLCRPKLVAVTRPGTGWDAPIIHYTPTSVFRGVVDAFLAERGIAARVIACSDDPLFMLDAAAHDAIIAFVPAPVARAAIEARHVAVLATLDDAPVTVHAVHHDTGASSLLPTVLARLSHSN